MVTSIRRAAVLALVLAALASIQVWAAPVPVITVMIADNSSQQRTAAKVDELVNPYSDYILGKTGVRVALDWQTGEDADYNQKVTLALASGNAPDLIFMGGNDQFAMNIVRSGALEPLNASFGKYPNLNRVYNDEY
jgi:ABC-type glycerol-3-phosphate transport system substrate-binding protein